MTPGDASSVMISGVGNNGVATGDSVSSAIIPLVGEGSTDDNGSDNKCGFILGAILMLDKGGEVGKRRYCKLPCSPCLGVGAAETGCDAFGV